MFTDPSTAVQAAGGSPAVQAAFDDLAEADICFMNCEMSLTRRGSKVEKTINLRSDPAVAASLAELGIHVVTIANNHMLDYGHSGLCDTLEALDAAGIARVGAGASIDEALRPHFREVDGRRFAFLGVAATLPPGFAASRDRPGIAPIRVDFSFDINPNLMSEQPGTAPVVRTHAVDEDVDRVASAISDARAAADHVIIAVHWGLTRRRVTPFQGMIAEYQPPLGRALIDAGADAVIGNHSHNLHGIEVYRGRPIFYSLGNFIFQDPHDYMEPESLIVHLEFTAHSMRARLRPILIDDEGFPRLPDDVGYREIATLVESLSQQFGTRFIDHGDEIEVVLSE